MTANPNVSAHRITARHAVRFLAFLTAGIIVVSGLSEVPQWWSLQTFFDLLFAGLIGGGFLVWSYQRSSDLDRPLFLTTAEAAGYPRLGWRRGKWVAVALSAQLLGGLFVVGAVSLYVMTYMDAALFERLAVSATLPEVALVAVGFILIWLGRKAWAQASRA
jgi:hypothetical protein